MLVTGIGFDVGLLRVIEFVTDPTTTSQLQATVTDHPLWFDTSTATSCQHGTAPGVRIQCTDAMIDCLDLVVSCSVVEVQSSEMLTPITTRQTASVAVVDGVSLRRFHIRLDRPASEVTAKFFARLSKERLCLSLAVGKRNHDSSTVVQHPPQPKTTPTTEPQPSLEPLLGPNSPPMVMIASTFFNRLVRRIEEGENRTNERLDAILSRLQQLESKGGVGDHRPVPQLCVSIGVQTTDS